MAQQNIDFGTFPDDPSADAIRTAFQKVQQNFNEIYATTANAGVLSVNQSPGAGITLSSAPTGNVVVNADISSLTVRSTSLGVNVGSTPDISSSSALYTSAAQTLWVEIPANLSISNLIANGTISATGNLTSANASLGNSATANYFIGSGNNLSNIQGANVSGQVGNALVAGTVYTAAQPNITSTGTLTSLSVSGNIISGNIYANSGTIGAQYLAGDGSNISNVIGLTGPVIANGTSYVNVATSGGNIQSNVGGATIQILSSLGANYTGALSASGNLTAANASLGNLVTANYFQGNFYGVANSATTATTAGTVTTNAQPNITSTGTLTSLSVSGNANIGNVGTDSVTATGNITGGNLITGGVISATGNANVGNIGATDGVFTTVAGSLTTASQPNITSTGTLTSLSVSGNANIGNIGTAGLVTATGNIGGGNINTVGIVTATGNITGGNLVTGGVISATGNANVGNIGTAGLITATGNITGGNIITGGVISATGNANVGNIGATAGVFTTVAGSLTTAAQPNVTSLGTLSGLNVTGHANLANVSISGNLIAGNIQVDSIVNGNSSVDITNPNGNVTVTIDGNNIAVFTTTGAHIEGILISDNANLGNTANANYFIGNLYGTANVAVKAGTVTANVQPNITSIGNLASLTVAGNSNLGSVSNVYIGGGAPSNTYLTTDGSGNLSWSVINNYPPGGANTQIQFNDNGSYQGNTGFTFNKTTGAVAIPGNLSAPNISGTLTTASQPNITEVGTLGYLIVNTNGYIAAGNANIDAGNIFANTGTIKGSLLTGALTTASQPNITATGTLTTLSVSGNANVGNIGATAGVFTTISGSGAALTSLNASNITSGTIGASYVATLNQNTTGYAATVSTAAQPNITSTGTLASLSVTANANIGNIGTNGLITATGNITGGNLVTGGVISATGNANVGNIGAAAGVFTTVTGSLTTASQPNVTSLGTLSTLSVSGNANVGNIGAAAGVFTTVAGSLTTASQPNVTSLGTLSTLSVSGNANVGNIGATNLVGTLTTASQTNITSVGTLASLSVTANANIGNIGTSGLITATGNITGGNLITAGLVTVTGNVNAGNIITGGLVSATGNVSGANVVATTFDITGVTTSITAAGTNQAGATALTKAINIVSTVSAGANGVVLPTAVAGMSVYITNNGSTALNVYPASGGQVNAGGTNTAYSQPTGSTVHYIAPTTTQWYTVTGTYA